MNFEVARKLQDMELTELLQLLDKFEIEDIDAYRTFKQIVEEAF
jgi:hypothetical protein